jgi:4-alpha-glucanotransferase
VSEPDDLTRLAEALGLFGGYRSTTGEWVTPSTEATMAAVAALGHDLARPEEAADVLAGLAAERTRQLLEPVVVAWDGVVGPVPLGPGGGEAHGRRGLRAAVRLESGRRSDDPVVRDGQVWFGGRLPLGRHELLVTDTAGTEHVAVILAAPTVAWRPAAGAERQWGVFVPTYALHRRSAPAAVGDLADLEAAFDWLHRQGGQVVVTLPMLATFLDTDADGPAEVSPYAPVSRRFWNELYADLRAPAAQAGVDLGPAGGEFVDHVAAWAPRRRVLQRLSDRLSVDGDLEFFRRTTPLVEEYARFRAAAARHGRNWRAWPSRLPTDVDEAEVRLHLTAQWLMDRQLGRLHRKVAGRGQVLALDLPIGSHPDGFDVWRERGLFVEGMSVGAPPDDFFTRGQDWGFPPLHPQRSRADGHRFLQDCIAHHVRHAGLLRVDHILGLLRQYWVPHGAGASDGLYVRYPLDELLAVLALECARAGAMVVGENLGTVPPEITEAMARHGMLGCAVAQFDLGVVLDGDDRPLPRPPAASVATLNTHDTATFAGFWSGADADDRAALGLLDEPALEAEHRTRRRLRQAVTGRLGLGSDTGSVEVAAGLLGEASASDAALVVITVEDGWAAPDPQNVPGTVHERPNWRRRVAVPLDDWDGHEGLGRLVDAVVRHRPGWDRPDPPGQGWRRQVPEE